jgi:endonuclease/exonuclease/phosphatase family metal-dependent hydrolase
MHRIARLALVLGVLAPAAFASTAVAVDAAGAAAKADDAPSVRIVDLNLLHGQFCPPDTDGCQAPDRVALLSRQLEDSKCPEIVGLEEINQNLANLLVKTQKKTCDGKYHLAFPTKKLQSLDTEQVLTTLPIKSTKVIKLVGAFRTASRVVLTSPIGPLVLVVTHQDGDPATPAQVNCKSCKPPCSTVEPIYNCQTAAAAGLADETGGPKAVRVLMGDFNVTPTSGRYASLISAGWIDSHLAAGNAECDGTTGVNCTGGREDKAVEALKDPNARESERIDFLFVKPSSTCDATLDPVSDANGNGLGTGLFEDTPAVNGPGGLVWPSDHTGVSADISCTKG